MAKFKLVNGERVQMTAEEEAARDAEVAAWTAGADARALENNREQRRLAYPSIGDQLDMLWHAVDTGDWTAAKVKTTEFYTALKAVKDANPKP